MGTIKERAKKSIHQHYNCNGEYPCTKRGYCVMCGGKNTAYDCCECGADEFYEGYIAGVAEQKQIDIDKACEWMEKWFLDSKYYTPQEVLDGLRKAMEE